MDTIRFVLFLVLSMTAQNCIATDMEKAAENDLKMTAYGQDQNAETPDMRRMDVQPTAASCHRAGQFLGMPVNPCMYQICLRQFTAGSQVPQFVPRPQSCPPGTSVPASYISGYNMPCTQLDSSCTARRPAGVHPIKVVTYNGGDKQPADAMTGSQSDKVKPDVVNTVEELTQGVRLSTGKYYQTYLKQLEDHQQQIQRHQQTERVQKMRTPVMKLVTYPTPRVAVDVSAGKYYQTYLKQLEDHQQQIQQHQQTERVQKMRTAVMTPVTYPTPLGASDGQCRSIGHLLKDPSSKCRYLVCTVGTISADGGMTFQPVAQPCPRGTSVPSTFVDKKGGASPCSVKHDAAC